jgi:hypothetical protein
MIDILLRELCVLCGLCVTIFLAEVLTCDVA